MLMMIFGVLELGLVLLVSATLDNAAEATSRDMRTGVFQIGGGDSSIKFREKICDRMGWLEANCTSNNMKVETRLFSDFGGLAEGEQINKDDDGDPCFAAPRPTDIALVRVSYTWPIYTPLINQALINTEGNKREMVTTTAFRTEPYGSPPGPGAAKCQD
jgi:Flp pilus assembly protein TadG